jgi:cytochrome c-type biogenesis protein CcmE
VDLSTGQRGDGLDDSADALELSPRTAGSTRPPRRRSRNWAAIGLLVVVLAGMGVIVSKFLTSAVDYYCNVDEMNVRKGCGADRRLRVQGTVDEGTLRAEDGTTFFTVSFNNATLPVRYDGEPGGIFEECVPVVVHGILKDGTFNGDRVEVKHSNEYEAENKDRLDEAESSACS